jgi:hypothetical protein
MLKLRTTSGSPTIHPRSAFSEGRIEPGMRRKDLGGVFATEGGLSNRFQRTYVHVDCPYIKVNVRFKAASDKTNALREDPDDVIESVSQPFLQWSTMD